jgi:uncharacterized protein (DUF1786 family)
VTYNPSVHAASAQDIVNYALTLALSLLNATRSNAQMICNSLRFVSKLAVDKVHRTACHPVGGGPKGRVSREILSTRPGGVPVACW